MRGNNPNGNRMLASDLVFLNGHANSSKMYFNHNGAGGVYKTGVSIYNDATDNGYQFAGLNSINMGTCDHISFVGCQTAVGTTNLASKAVSKGATSSLGFTSNINSRNNNGPQWLQKYNYYLSIGYAISECVKYATAAYPSSNLGTYAKIYGNTSNGVWFSKSASETNTEFENIETNIQGIELSNVTDASIPSGDQKIDSILTQIKKLDESFSPDQYKMTVNMFAPQDGTGMIIFNYYIGDNIKTNKAFVVSIENNVVIDIISSQAATNITRNRIKSIPNETMLKNLVNAHRSANKAQVMASDIASEKGINSIDSVIEEYIYDFETDELIYSRTVFYAAPEMDGAIVDCIQTVQLN